MQQQKKTVTTPCWHVVNNTYTVCLHSVAVRRQQTRRSPFYRCVSCKRDTRAFFKPSAVCANWKLNYIILVRLIYYFKMGFSVKKIYRLMGGNLPGDRGCPIARKSIGKYLFQMRKRVADVGFQKLLGVRLAGPCQADETFVRTKAKFNRGRARVNRKFTLVSTYIMAKILMYIFCFAWGAGYLRWDDAPTGGNSYTWSKSCNDAPIVPLLVFAPDTNHHRCMGRL